MSVSEPLGPTVRTRHDSSAMDGLHIVESVPIDGSLRRRRRAARRVSIEADPLQGLPSSAIHELRTPLTSIHGYAQVLQRGLADNPRAMNGLGVIVRESGRLTRMLADLSDLAELTEPDPTDAEAQRCGVDVRSLVDAAAEAVVSRDPDGHDILVFGQARLVCDGSRLAQAVTRVLTNAIQYSPAQSRITVHIDDDEDWVSVSIADDGIGIAADDAERIYQPFERGANAREFGGRGLGLGLFIARRALALEGGTLTHMARPAVGTVFLIELPRD